jgi:hypothetical protein
MSTENAPALQTPTVVTYQGALILEAHALLTYRLLDPPHQVPLRFIAVPHVSMELSHALGRIADCLITSLCRLPLFSSSHAFPTEPSEVVQILIHLVLRRGLHSLIARIKTHIPCLSRKALHQLVTQNNTSNPCLSGHPLLLTCPTNNQISADCRHQS